MRRWKHQKVNRRQRGAVLLLCTLGLLFGMCAPAAAKNIPYVYVAGNPDCYPVEYFNEQTGQYEGLMQYVYAQLEEETGIEFRYYTHSDKDERYSYAANRQVEIITCLIGEQQSFQDLNLLFSDNICQFQVEGRQYSLQLGFTPIADEEMVTQIEAALERLDSSSLLNATITYVNANDSGWQNKYRLAGRILMITSAVLLLLTILGIVIWRTKRNRQSMLKYVDPLTRIGNDQYFIACFKQKIDEQNRYAHCAVSVVFEAEELKRYLPQKVYEELVANISDNIDLMIHKEDFYAYVETGRFEIIMGLNHIDDITHWVERFAKKLEQYMESYASGNIAKLYFGIYILSVEDTEVYEILRKTGYAAEIAKKKDLLFCVYTAEMEKRFRQETMVRTMAKEMMQKNEVILFYQPVMSAKEQQICAVEACSRWENPRDGYIRPDKFISVLEQSEDIADFDLYIIHQVCEWFCTKQQLLAEDFICTVNVSRKSLTISGFADKVQAVLVKFQVKASRLALEITQKEYAGKTDMMENAQKLKELGVRLVIDNYGGEGTSLTDILQLRPDFVKLNRYFLTELSGSEGIIRLTRLLTFLHELEVQVVMQGVETQQQLEHIKLLSCDYLQGYYFYPPLPVRELEETLQQVMTGA